ncbi:PHB depolymerase family esterase [Geopyxis carbonaria]|nr:PHB depolymerase family esterase [Geopyxis carbonaria]
MFASITLAALVEVTNFGSNPGGAKMYISVPSNLAAKPAIVLALHGCSGTGPYYSLSTDYSALSETHGFITIFPSATQTSEHCWDVATTASNTHGGGSDSLSLVNMVQYALTKYGGDPARVFVTGTSSGAMMANLLAGTYPDVFAAGVAYSGLPCSCLLGSPGSGPSSADPACANGQVKKSPQEWAAVVEKCYPGYAGEYPKMMIWHGTADGLVNYANLGETLKQWAGVHGVEFAANQTGTPQSGYTKMVHGDGTKLVGFSASGVGHTVPVNEAEDLKWFGITE